ncbi:MAG: hypothetical protein GY903_05545 [Fuerstiella sp.]|nr:hypothetical protein [Fuerstiella sp.]MCP4853938.1 hypothetical protein [Fuerstiella sp.]
MTINNYSVGRFVALAVILVTAYGCQSELVPLPEVTVSIPDEFKVGGTAWQKQTTPQQADTDCLSNFFARNQDLVGSPEFEGQPTVFHAGKRDRRFYWLHSSIDGVHWQCVEFKNRRFSVTDGTESPFNKL